MARITGKRWQKYPERASYYADSYVHRYGSEGNRKEMCADCGRTWIGPTGNYYLLARETAGRKAVQDSSGDLYVTPDLAARVDWQKYRSVRLLPRPVLDAPDPPVITSEVVLRPWEFKLKPEYIGQFSLLKKTKAKAAVKKRHPR